jgi:hypothetical protein
MAIATPQARQHRADLSIVYAAGMFLVFFGQRVLSTGKLAWASTTIGCLAVFTVTVMRWLVARTAPKGDRTGQRALFMLYGLGSASLLAYLLTSDLMMLTLGTSLARHAPSVNNAVSTLWPALWVVGSLPVASVEMAYKSMKRAPVFDQARLTTSLMSGLGVALALVFASASVYAAKISELRFDLSYFRTTKPGESTLKILGVINQPLTITSFFPPTSEVGQEVARYLDGLKGRSPLLTVEKLDHGLDPGRARELGVTGNGVIAVSRGTLRRQVALPLEPERARAELRKLDDSVNSMLLNVTRPSRRIYFTKGHGERVFRPTDDTDRRSTLSYIKQNLTDQGFEVLDFSIANGLGSEIPSDALAVMAVGPLNEFLPEEAGSLERYVKESGGSLLLALDAESGKEFSALVSPFGIVFSPAMLANDVAYWRKTGQPSDRANIASVGFGSHASVATLAKFGFQSPVLFAGAGSLLLTDGFKPAPEVTIQTDGNTWADKNLDFNVNGTETRQQFALAAAVSFETDKNKHGGRALVVTDADAFGDIAMQNPGNKKLFEDTLHWLSRDEAIAGEVISEEDVAISHSRKQDMAWFYLTSFVPPLALLVIGFLFTHRRRSERARDEHVKSTKQTAEAV